jgi:hypothetical protein
VKKNITWGVVWLIWSAPQFLDAQTIYGKAGVGYRFGYPNALIDRVHHSNSGYTSPGVQIYTEDTQGVYGTFGKGMALEGAIGIKGRYIGVELGISHLIKYNTEAISSYVWTNETNVRISATETHSHENTMLSINPCLVLSSDVGGYARAGAILAFPTYTYKERSTQTAAAALTSRTTEYKGAMALGYTVAMGWIFGVGGIDVYLEGDFVSLEWAPARSEITEYMQGGIDRLSTLSYSERHTRYEDSFMLNEKIPIDPNGERVEVKSKYPYSSVGLKAGIMIGF